MESMTSVLNQMNLSDLTFELKRCFRRSAKDVVYIGYILRRVLDLKLWQESYDDFDTYLQSELHIDYSVACRFIQINKKFSFLGNSADICEKYLDFSQGLLIEMLNMTPEQEAKVTPDMTVKQAREIKKKDKKPIPAQPQQLPDKQETIIDGNFRELKVPEQLATSQLEIVNQDCDLQPELPLLKNNDQRKEWLSRYKDWGLWYHDDHIDVNYYKFDFADGSRLIAAEFPHRRNHWNNGYSDQVYFHLLEKNCKGYKSTYDKQYVHAPDSETYIVDFLKDLQKKK